MSRIIAYRDCNSKRKYFGLEHATRGKRAAETRTMKAMRVYECDIHDCYHIGHDTHKGRHILLLSEIQKVTKEAAA